MNTCLLWGEFNGEHWFALTKASNAENVSTPRGFHEIWHSVWEGKSPHYPSNKTRMSVVSPVDGSLVKLVTIYDVIISLSLADLLSGSINYIFTFSIISRHQMAYVFDIWYIIDIYLIISWWRHQMETFPRNWPFVREIHRSPVNFPHKGQWRGALMFSLIYAWINEWVNNREAGDLRRQHGHYDVIVMVNGRSALYIQNHWLFGNSSSQNIGSNGIDISLPEYSGFSTRRVEDAWLVTGLKGCFPSENVYSNHIKISNISTSDHQCNNRWKTVSPSV